MQDYFDTSQIIGFIGTGIVVFAYIPQIRHLVQEHCSEGLSLRAFRLWFIGAIFLLVHAFIISDLVFIILQGFHVITTSTILFLTKKYRNSTCSLHVSVP